MSALKEAECDAEVLDLVRRLTDALEHRQWQEDAREDDCCWNMHNLCVSCSGCACCEPRGHAPNCPLAALLKEAREFVG